MSLISIDIPRSRAVRILCVMVAVTLAVHAPLPAGGDDPDRSRATTSTPVIVPVAAPGDGQPILPTRHLDEGMQQEIMNGLSAPERLILPRTVLLRSGATPSSAPRRCLLVTQWNTTSL